MSLPVSQYEALLAEVRGLRRKAQRVQQLATPLLSSVTSSTSPKQHQNPKDASPASLHSYPLSYKMESVVLERQHNPAEYDRIASSSVEGDTTCSEDECGGAHSTQLSVSSEPISHGNRGMSMLYHGTWPVERTMWNSEPTSLGPSTAQHCNRTEMTSVMSFASSSGGAPLDRVLSSPDRSRRSSQQLEAKVDMVYSLLSMLGGQEHADMGETLLALSTSPESCLAMRQSGCIPLLVQLVQSDREAETRKKAAQALHNLVHSNPDEKLRKRETRVLKLMEQTRAYMAYMHNKTDVDLAVLPPSEDGDSHPVQTVAHLMKLSFDEGHRQAICQLGGIHVIANLVESEHALHGSTTDEGHCVLLRRYSCMALTNLTFGDSGNKALLCSFRDFMRALVLQLQSPCDELRQVTASVLRNLSWRADSTSKEILREVGAVSGLMKAAMINNKENTLKSILSALWNLSAHCTENKSEICAVEGALGFLVSMLTYKTPSKSLAIIENAGGILRNISSQIAIRDDYREVLRDNNCLQVLLDQLKSPSLTIVSNACGTLWNLSAKNQTDQEMLWQMGAPTMLRSLNHSKHKMIAMGSSAALKNLLASRPTHNLLPQMDATAKALDLPTLPTLGARKQKALLQELEQNLSETFENIDKDSPIKTCRDDKFLLENPDKLLTGPASAFIQKSQKLKQVLRSESQECVSHSEVAYESRNSHSDTSIVNDSFNNAFASLNINEPSTSYQNRTRIPQGFGSTSLPYVKPSNPYIPVKNYAACSYEEEAELTEQPIDYSRKYLETKATKEYSSVTDYKATKEYKPASGSSFSSATTKVVEDESFGIYAETDLDQPTDYSLRYAEDDSESEEICDKIAKTEGADFVQDTVKTYCTEDTPYETPFNYSTATSMSDLRETALDSEKQVIDNDKLTNANIKTDKHRTLSDEKDRCSIEDISEIDTRPKVPEKTLKSQFSSGLASPEKPVNYAEEGTPGYFSRVSSFSSLTSIPVGEKSKDESGIKSEGISDEPTVRAVGETEEILQKNDVTPIEGKAVKFEQVVNYAEETPLMFSRSSSLASLDSIEQHSIHEDRESVISDFSRLTSGIVSPSELPDSPTQTVPPSPRQRKAPLEFPSTSRAAGGVFHRTPADGKPQPTPRTAQKTSIFEDNVTKFKEESTPVQFSTATSLSSLTIDDHDELTRSELKAMGKRIVAGRDKAEESVKQEETGEKQDVEQEKRDNLEVNDDMPVVSESEEDEDILAACINDGMQNNRHRQNMSPLSKLSTPSTYKYQPKSVLRPHGSGIPLPRTGIPTRTGTTSSSPIRIPDSRLQAGMYSDSVHNYCTEDTPAMLSHAGSNSDLSMLTTTSDTNLKKEEKSYLSDDSSNLSGDNENILAECIQSAMPKARKSNKSVIHNRPMSGLPIRNVQTSTPIKPFSRTDPNCSRSDDSRRSVGQALPVYLAAKDEVESYAVENSPCHFSLRSSLSDLTVDGSVAGGLKPSNNSSASQPSPRTETKDQDSAAGPSSLQSENLNVSNVMPEQCISLSRQESLSSLSADSLCSLEQEQALLEQCISSGMPKSKHSPVPSKPSPIPSKPIDVNKSGIGITKPIGVATKQFNISKVQVARGYEDKHRAYGERNRDFDLHEEKLPNSKNVNVTSAAGSTIVERNAVRPTTPPTVAGVEHTEKPERKWISSTRMVGTRVDTSRDKCSPSEENLSTELTKSGCDKSLGQILDNSFEENCPYTDNLSPERSYSNSDNCANLKLNEKNGFDFENVDLEVTTKTVDNRMLDPDAMIESLDRFTAELISQAEAAHSNKDGGRKFTGSITEGDTWNDDTSPNDVTFPSISGSAPNVITFKSEIDETGQEIYENCKLDHDIDFVDGLNDPEQKSNDFSSINTSTMTESTLIAVEATKIATVFKNEAEMAQSITSIQSLELDCIQPPSHMNSLTNSTNGLEHQLLRGSPKLVSSKKSLQTGLLARRALTNSLNQASSLESLDNHSLSNLDHMNPPSAMGDILDMIDLEGSMTSVASLTSEVVDVKPDFITNGFVNKDTRKNQQQPNPIFTVKQPANMLYLLTNNSLSDLENVNPPSLFNEITDMCNSLADIATEAICSETEAFEDCNTHFIDTTLQTEDDDVTQFSDAQSVTPIQSDLSSAESSPKKIKSLSKRLTPKQKRKLVQERYRTYTVAAEMVVSEEQNSTTEDFKTVDCFSEYQTVAEFAQNNNQSPNLDVRSSTGSTGSGKTTPKERRQSDRARFQTQVLDEAVTTALQQMSISKTETSNATEEVSNSSPVSSSPQSPQRSPGKTKLSIRRNFMQRRLENQDRFKTRTLSESSLSPDISSASPPSVTNSNDLQYLVQKEASRVLKKLKETKSHPDELLDCETLSLISNEDDSEHNSGSSINYRTYTKNCGVRGSHLPNIRPASPATSKEKPRKVQVQAVKVNVNENTRKSDNELNTSPGKPKIVKPTEKQQNKVEINEEENQVKGIRGRRKPLYSKTNTANSRVATRNNNIRPIRSITSNLVKNVTSAIKSGTNLKNVTTKQSKLIIAKPPVAQAQTKALKPPSGYRGTNTRSNQVNSNYTKAVGSPQSASNSGSPRHSNSGSPRHSNSGSPKHSNSGSPKPKIEPTKTTPPPPLERQGTFTKDDQETSAPKSRIPTPASSNLPTLKSTSRIARAISQTNSTVGKTVTRVQNAISSARSTKSAASVKSVSSDRASNLRSASSGIFSRSSSADSRDSGFNRRQNIHNSSSSQSLKSDSSKNQNGAVKRSSLSNISQRSNSNSSITSNGSGSKKQVTSKIASLWKKVEEQKKQAPKKDSRVWIQPTREQPAETEESPRLIRSNTFESKDGVVLRKKNETSDDPTKRMSRLGSFIVMDENGGSEIIEYSESARVVSGAATEVTF